jgi:hypothetical protein
MSLSVVNFNVGINIRIGQVMILLVFALTLLIDFRKKDLNEILLIFFVFFGFLLLLISKNSIYSKIGEIKFVIKYILIFPATFYIAFWLVKSFKIKDFLKMIDTVIVLYILFAVLLYFYPIAAIHNDRGELTGFQGTFLETGWFAMVLGSFTLLSILLRLDYNLKFNKINYILYLSSFLAIIFSKNKTVWISVIVILIFISLFKAIIANKENARESIKKLKNINSMYFIFFVITISILFFIVNNLLPEPIITLELIKIKMNEERGKAFFAAMDLLKNTDWLGGYGFGFIEQYFSTYTDQIIGLGTSTGMIFNSYIDVWISVGLLGLFYHFTLLYISIERSHLSTLCIPIYWFVSANTNPSTGDEFYYLFLGFSYGFIYKYKKGLN